MSGPGCDPNCRDPQVTGGLLVTDFYREKHGVPMSSHIFYSWFQFPGQMGFLLANSIWHIVNVRILLCCFFFVFLKIAGKHQNRKLHQVKPLVDPIKAYHQQTVTTNSNSAVEPPARASFTCENPKVSSFVPGRQRIARGLLAFYPPH